MLSSYHILGTDIGIFGKITYCSREQLIGDVLFKDSKTENYGIFIRNKMFSFHVDIFKKGLSEIKGRETQTDRRTTK